MDDGLVAILLSSGDRFIDAFCALALVIVPLWLILHYLAKFRAGRQLNAQDAEIFERLTQTATRMEQRMLMLERILDAEIPDWRQTHHSGIHDHETI